MKYAGDGCIDGVKRAMGKRFRRRLCESFGANGISFDSEVGHAGVIINIQFGVSTGLVPLIRNCSPVVRKLTLPKAKPA